MFASAWKGARMLGVAPQALGFNNGLSFSLSHSLPDAVPGPLGRFVVQCRMLRILKSSSLKAVLRGFGLSRFAKLPTGVFNLYQETRNGALKMVYSLYKHFGVAKSAKFEGGSGQVLPEWRCTHVQGYLAHKKQHPPKTLQ